METVFARAEDEIILNLVHFFVTKENYIPMIVQGAKNEIWLENPNGPYRVIRININTIYNDEQFKYDQYKIKAVLNQIKKKTFSFKVNALNFNLKEDDRVSAQSLKGIDSIRVNDIDELSDNKDISSIFPDIKTIKSQDTKDALKIFNITNEINAKTDNNNKIFEKVFTPKKIVVTYVLIALCALMYLVTLFLDIFGNYNSNYVLLLLGANYGPLVKAGHVYRVLTYAFLHGSLMHLIVNMYSLFAIGPTLESRFGKVKFLVIYLVSAIIGGMLSAGFSNSISIGASGAIFGLMGSLVYFGLCYRLTFKEALVKRIIPVIILNLALGFMTTGIDNACHIGGLIGGFLITMALGVPGSNKKNDKINGIIMLSIFFLFTVYLVFFR